MDGNVEKKAKVAQQFSIFSGEAKRKLKALPNLVRAHALVLVATVISGCNSCAPRLLFQTIKEFDVTSL